MTVHGKKLTDATYNEAIENVEGPFALVFTSKHCPHCVTVENMFKSINGYEGFHVFFIASEKSPKLVEKFMVRGFPLTVFVRADKTAAGGVSGAAPWEEFASHIEKLTRKSSPGLFSRLFRKKN